MRDGGPLDQLRVRALPEAPPRWDRFLARVPDAEFAAGASWTTLASQHYPGARPLWAVVETAGGELLGGLPVFVQRRWGCVRLQSSFDGTVAGPQVAADLPGELQDRVFAALCRWLAGQVGGRTVLAVMTVASPDARRRLSALGQAESPPGRRLRLEPFQSAVVDCRPGPQRIAYEAWTKNRRNERNRGLRRGCTLHVEPDAAALADWYPIYLAQARGWAQSPVPLGFVQDLWRHERARVLLNTVRLEGRIVGGHFCVVSRNRRVPSLSGAEPSLLGTHFLNTLLYWQDILHACAMGLEAVDFGGCVGKDSLWEFKRRSGGEPQERLQLQIYSGIGGWLQAARGLRRRLRGADR